MTPPDLLSTERFFKGVAFALLSPGAPRGEFPVSLTDRDDGPQGEPHESFVLVELYESESPAKQAVKDGARWEGEFRRLLVRLEFSDASAVDARSELNAMALRRGDDAQLDLLSSLYEWGVDLVRLRGPEGELVLIFTDSIGLRGSSNHRIHIAEETVVTERARPHPRLTLKEIALALGAAYAVDLLRPLIHLSVPLWVPMIAFLAAAAARPLWAAAKARIHRALVRAIQEAAPALKGPAPPTDTRDQDPKVRH